MVSGPRSNTQTHGSTPARADGIVRHMGLLGLESRRDYELDGMIHYLVDTPDGAVGVLDRWKRDEQGRPLALIVAQGWFGRRRFAIPLEELIQIDHEARRIVLARGAAPLYRTLTQRLAALGPRRHAHGASNVRPETVSRRPALCGADGEEEGPSVVPSTVSGC